MYWKAESSKAVIIDPGADDYLILEAIKSQDISPQAILLTHGHVDHIGAVNSLRQSFGIPVFAGDGEQPLLSDPTANMSALTESAVTVDPPVNWLKDEELLVIADLSFKVLATPGHSPGGVCFLDESAGVVFVGDTLFYGSIGRTDFPGCSHTRLIDSISSKLLKLPNSIVCYPGHGPSTTIGAERVNNPFLKGDYFA